VTYFLLEVCVPALCIRRNLRSDSVPATIRDLAKDFDDEILASTVKQSTDDTPSKRPSSLTLLQIAREQLASAERMDMPPFLPERPVEMDYVLQAIYELLERLFHSFHVIETSLRKHLTEKLDVLLQDGKLRNPTCWGLNESIMLMLVLGREKEAENLLSNGRGVWACSWNTHGLTPMDIAKHDRLAIVELLASQQPELMVRQELEDISIEDRGSDQHDRRALTISEPLRMRRHGPLSRTVFGLRSHQDSDPAVGSGLHSRS
jgi:hypothetical protein